MECILNARIHKCISFRLNSVPARDQAASLRSTLYSTLSLTFTLVGLSGLEPPTSRLSGVRSNQLSYKPKRKASLSFLIWQPPTLPYRLQYSTIGRISLNHRVRDENGCVPYAHRHQKFLFNLSLGQINNNTTLTFSILRKEVIQPHLPIRLPCYDFTPVIRPAFDCCLQKWLGHRLRAFPTPMV